MNTWQPLQSIEDIQNVIDQSQAQKCLIFKHSTTCSISNMSQMRLNDHLGELDQTVKLFYLDLLQHRDISAKIAETFSVQHESPQVLLIDRGECIYDASHFDISIKEINETLEWHAQQSS